MRSFFLLSTTMLLWLSELSQINTDVYDKFGVNYMHKNIQPTYVFFSKLNSRKTSGKAAAM